MQFKLREKWFDSFDSSCIYASQVQLTTTKSVSQDVIEAIHSASQISLPAYSIACLQTNKLCNSLACEPSKNAQNIDASHVYLPSFSYASLSVLLFIVLCEPLEIAFLISCKPHAGVSNQFCESSYNALMLGCEPTSHVRKRFCEPLYNEYTFLNAFKWMCGDEMSAEKELVKKLFEAGYQAYLSLNSGRGLPSPDVLAVGRYMIFGFEVKEVNTKEKMKFYRRDFDQPVPVRKLFCFQLENEITNE